MKKIVCFFLLLTLSLPLFSCGEEEERKTKEKELFSPLIRFTVEEGRSAETRLFYLPQSDGFLYLLPHKDGGFSGGFVSPDRSVSSEAIFKSDAELDSVLVWEDSEDRAHVLTSKEVYTVLLKENGAHRTPLPEGLSLNRPVALNTISFINEREDLLLIHPVDFKETYVLAKRDAFPDFAGLISTADSGKTLWYAREGEAGEYKGIGSFVYGESTPSKEDDFPFDTYERIGETAVLFTRILEDGGALYLYRDLTTGKTCSAVSDVVFEGVTCDPAGKLLCGSLSTGESGVIHVIDLQKGAKKGEYTVNFGTPAPALAIDRDCKTLLIAVGSGDEEMLGTLDLTRF